MFQICVEGIQYVGIGNSTNKKDAQSNAAFDFANYLVRTGKIPANELPSKMVCMLVSFCDRIGFR